MSEFLKRHGPTVTLGALIVALAIFMWNATSTLYEATSKDVGAMRTEIVGLRSDLRTDVGNLRTEISGLRDDLRTDVTAMQTEISGLRKDFGDWRVDIERQLIAAGQRQPASIVLVDQDGEIAKALMKAMRTGGTVPEGTARFRLEGSDVH